MTDREIIVKAYPELPLNRREILRYAGTRLWDETLEAALAELKGQLTPKLCYTVCPEGFGPVQRPVLVLAATLGLAPDRLLLRYSRLEPAKALYVQAIGAERIETMLDEFCRDMKTRYPLMRPRRSPGYGDWPLELQKDIFRLLTPERRIGLTLNEKSLLMSPSKSVTALAELE